MRACLTTVTLLVVLVERVGTPKTTVATWLGAGVLSPPLVKFILVALPIVLSFEARLTGGAPVNVLLVGGCRGGSNRCGRLGITNMRRVGR